MIKTYCDRCEKQITEKVCRFSLACHIAEGTGEPGDYSRGHIDRDRQPTSGRTVDYDLCQRCYNEVALAAFRKLKRIEVPAS